MSRYSDYRRSTGAFDQNADRWDAERFSRERQDRMHPRGPPVLERPRRMEDERFEWRLQEDDRYGPPARRPGRSYDDDHLVQSSGPLVAYDRRGESPPPRPRLLRRQSSLDTFDRIPARKLDEYYHAPREAPSPPPRRRRSFRRSRESDFYDAIRIAEPDYYGDEEFRGFRERDLVTPPRRSGSRFRERVTQEVEKPYPRKGKTRMPKNLVHVRAIREWQYPYHEEGDMVIIELALSKEQIDEVIGRSREIKRQSEVEFRRQSPSPVRHKHPSRTMERLVMERASPRSSGDTLIIEGSPSRHRSHSRHYDLSERRIKRTVSRSRSISVHGRHRGRSSPVRMVGLVGRSSDDRVASEKPRTGPLAVVVRPRSSDDDLREYLELDRLHGRGDVIRDTRLMLGNGEQEEIVETKQDRKGPNPRIIRAMMATLT